MHHAQTDPLSIIMKIAIIFGLLASLQAAPDEIWIIEDPSQLSIYNRYEQRLSPEEKSLLNHNGPWRILGKSYTLSDQFTSTIRTEFENKIYYLQTDANNDLVNQTAAGVVKKIQTATIQGDTIRINTRDVLLIEPSGNTAGIEEGTLLRRIFTHQKRIFVLNLRDHHYGWITLTGKENWEIYRPPSTADAYEQYLFDRVDRVIQRFNIRLSRLFEYFNQHKDQQIHPPQWKISGNSEQLTYIFTQSPGDQKFRKSREYLYQELEDLLHGSAYKLTVNDSELVISKAF